MKPLVKKILKGTVLASYFCTTVLTEPAGAEMIRIIGDKSSSSPDTYPGQSLPAPNQSSPPTKREEPAIRLIGDKPAAQTTPANDTTTQPDQSRTPSPGKIITIIGDRTETAPKRVPEQLPANATDEKRLKATVTTENGSNPRMAPEQELAQRLEALKEEEERKAYEKAKQEYLAQVKAEQEHEAARQAAIKSEQDQIAARKAEELRKEAEKIAAEERAAALKVEEDRYAAARKALIGKPKPGIESLPPETIAGTTPMPAATLNGLDTFSDKGAGSDSDPGPAPSAIWDLYLSAKSNDPVLARTESRVVGSKADSDVLRSGLLPHVDSSAGVNFISQTLANYNTPTPVSYDYSALNYNVTARIALLNVPTLYSLSAAAAALNGEQAGVAVARQSLIVKFTESYFALLKAQTDIQIARGEIHRLKQVLDQSQAFLKTGIGDVIAVYEAQSRLDGAMADLTKSESSLRLAEQKLSSLVGKPVTSIVNYLPRQPAGPDPDNLDWWVSTMEKEQPVIRQAREGLAQTSAQRKAAKAEYLPVLQASGGYDVSRGTADLPSAEVRQWFVGASISLPLYSGGETSAKVRRAVASEEERQHSFDETLEQQRENVKQAYFNLRYNNSLIKALEQKKASAEIQLIAIKKGRKIGTRNAIDVLNADQAYSVALRDYTYALYDNITRVIQLKSAAGILTEADVSELSKISAPSPASGLNMLVSKVFQ